jgi:hypothetical protein
MAVADIPAPGAWRRTGSRLVTSLAAAAGKILSPHRASLAVLLSIPLTLAGAGCIDAAAFAGNTIAGLVVTGISLMWLESVIAADDEDDNGRYR